MKRILMIVGSMRKESFNKKLALVAKELISDRAEVSFLEYKDIPPMNQDIEYPAPEEIERGYLQRKTEMYRNPKKNR